MINQHSIPKSKSEGSLKKEDEQGSLSILDDIGDDVGVVDVEEHSSSEKRITVAPFSLQMAVIAASFCTVFIPKDPHIMTKILMAYRNILTFSPLLFSVPFHQVLFIFISIVPSLCIIMSSFLVKIGYFEIDQIQRPVKFLQGINRYISIPICLHAGEAIGYYLLSNSRNKVQIIIIQIIALVVWNGSNYAVGLMRFVNYYHNNFLFILAQQYPLLIVLFFSICNNNMVGSSSGVLVFSSLLFIISSLIIWFVVSKSPFNVPFLNNRSVSTVVVSSILITMNVVSYFSPHSTCWIIGFAFCAVFIVILAEYGKLPSGSFQKATKRNQKRQAYSEGLDDPTPPPSKPLFHIEVQDILSITIFISSALMMTFFNAMAARRMPIGDPLPDIVHDYFKCGQEIREAPVFQKMQFSNLLCVILIVGMILLTFLIQGSTSARKFLLIYGAMCFIRSISFFITSMPAPCAGLPNCPCADSKEIEALKKINPLKIALIWMFGFGMFAKLPQCGDLIISGHTMFIWCSLKWLMEVVARISRRNTYRKIVIISVFTFIIAATYIIISRNHYTIDVWLGLVIAEFCFDIYTFLEEKAESDSMNIFVEVIRWFETRAYPIKKEFKYPNELTDTSNT